MQQYITRRRENLAKGGLEGLQGCLRVSPGLKSAPAKAAKYWDPILSITHLLVTASSTRCDLLQEAIWGGMEGIKLSWFSDYWEQES